MPRTQKTIYRYLCWVTRKRHSCTRHEKAEFCAMDTNKLINPSWPQHDLPWDHVVTNALTNVNEWDPIKKCYQDLKAAIHKLGCKIKKVYK